MQIRDRIKDLRRVKASTLRPDPKNWRTHPKAQADALRGILAEVGYVDALMARELPDGSLQLVDGHLRAETTPDCEVPVLVVDLNDEEAAKVLTTFDPLSAMAESNKEQLKALLQGVETQNAELGKLLEQIAQDNRIELVEKTPGAGGDDFDTTPKDGPTRVQKGELWVLGEHRLLCGDCGDTAEVERLFAGAPKAKLMATDPPYGVDYSKVKDGIPRPGFRNHQELWGDIEGDSHEGPALQTWLEGIFGVATCFLDHAAWYLWHAHLTQGYFAAAAAAAADVLIHRQIIWRKRHLVLTRSGMYHWIHEPCYYGWVKGQQPEWFVGKDQTSVWEVDHDCRGERVHPTQKPVELFAIPMRNHTRSGDVCYEPFAGSGSQIIAAERLGRRCFAMEIEPRYADVILARWEAETGKKAEKHA